MRLGIFGGAFNPVHNGHINLAESYIKSLSLDKLVVIPTANPPHRSGADFADECHRIKMLSLAFESVEKAEVSDIEFKREGKSYTYDTIEQLKSMYNHAEIFLIIGADQFLSFTNWYKYDEILKEAVLCTAPREKDMVHIIKDYAENILQGAEYFIADFEPVVVSSSEIRERIINNKDASSLLPEKVYKYIKETGLYSE